MSNGYIRIEGAREHNLKNVDVDIPRNRLTVVTGLSGSGKSSLAFDTLYAEGQRRYVESLSAYARQFLNQLQKPDVDHIEGLSPAIAIEQRTAGSNPRSIVATTTEIHDYLRLLYSSIGVPHCPECKKEVSRQSAEQIVDQLLSLPNRTRLALLAPLVRGRKGEHEQVFDAIRKMGFVRVRVDGEIHDVDAAPSLDRKKAHIIDAVVDRLIITSRIRTRLTDSVEMALKHGKGLMIALRMKEDETWEEIFFSEKNACPDCSLSFEELSARHFSFNSHYGACPKCAGLGTLLTLDEKLIIPDSSLTLEEGAVQAWRRGGRRLIIYYKQVLRAVAKHYRFGLDRPYKKLTPRIRNILLHGSGEELVEFGYWRGGGRRRYKKPFEGIIPNLMRRYDTTDSDFTKQRLRKYMSRQQCPDCMGARLKREVIACTVGGSSIVDVTGMSILRAQEFFESLELTPTEQGIAGEILKEINRRLRFMVEVGLEYLTLDRESGTLSGGEAQRIRLATQIGSGLVGVMYVLDEPSIGLHQRDNHRLITMLKELRDRGNTVIVVEHDEPTIRAADHVIDLGPGAGRHGGEVVCSGDVETLLKHEASLTARYMNGQCQIHVPRRRKKAGKEALKIYGAEENNLKKINVSIPLGLLVCVTGVSGSGKSTLVDDILRRALFRFFHGSPESPGAHVRITGMDKLDKVIVIDQSPIGRTPRSNPATYTGAFTFIRKLFSETAASKVRGFGPGRYSFNVKGGRCETCKGDGTLRLEMHFLPDVYVTCEQCGGLRYNSETLEVHYGGKTIAEVLAMTINEAMEFFENIPTINRKLRTLYQVGLGYLQLGQSATTLSGGEAQRVKLAAELSKKATGSTLYLLDEPTTGLHFADVQKLLEVLHRLRDAGNTVVVIEHNLDVVKTADYIIDLGPEGGDAGGEVVAVGSPEDIVHCRSSYTGKFLKKVLS
ncbi:MAG: excinuclease ABC subunit UvrA [Kiritimatiellia bacterium]|jgi:excinuclease ABC subunit A|nr:excinuclease ABC subunit UvrA [Kiritimatiellia bacterium]MDP6848666.1 excinuclease ABC subunit UvrA [Kiritimatiellia bacterium]